MLKRTLFFISIPLILFSCEYNNEDDLYNDGNGNDNDTALVLLGEFKFNGNLDNEVDNGIELVSFGDPQFTSGINDVENGAISLDGEGDFLSSVIGFHEKIGISLWFSGNVDYAKTEHRVDFPALIDYGAKSLYTYVDAYSYATVLIGGTDTATMGNKEFYLASNGIWTHLYLDVTSTDTSSSVSSLYINGNLSGQTDNFNFNPLTDAIFFGKSSLPINGELNSYIGNLDEIRIYNGSLSSNQIKELSKLSSYEN